MYCNFAVNEYYIIFTYFLRDLSLQTCDYLLKFTYLYLSYSIFADILDY